MIIRHIVMANDDETNVTVTLLDADGISTTVNHDDATFGFEVENNQIVFDDPQAAPVAAINATLQPINFDGGTELQSCG